MKIFLVYMSFKKETFFFFYKMYEKFSEQLSTRIL